MKKILLQTFFGILAAGGGIYCTFLAIQGIGDGKTWLFIPAVLCLCLAIYFFFQAGKSDNSVIAKPSDAVSDTADSGITKIGLERMLTRNNEISKEWEDINTKKDKLRMLEISASAEEQADK